MTGTLLILGLVKKLAPFLVYCIVRMFDVWLILTLGGKKFSYLHRKLPFMLPRTGVWPNNCLFITKIPFLVTKSRWRKFNQRTECIFSYQINRLMKTTCTGLLFNEFLDYPWGKIQRKKNLATKVGGWSQMIMIGTTFIFARFLLHVR